MTFIDIRVERQAETVTSLCKCISNGHARSYGTCSPTDGHEWERLKVEESAVPGRVSYINLIKVNDSFKKQTSINVFNCLYAFK